MIAQLPQWRVLGNYAKSSDHGRLIESATVLGRVGRWCGDSKKYDLEMEQSPRVASQNAIEIRGRKFQLLDEGIRIFDILRGKQIRADHDAIRTDFVDEETQGLRIVVQVIVMKTPHVLFERPCRLQLI